ncbi:pseudouridine synthase [Candidatus Tokpelaia sp.]|uniref:pseudouridine synthase n=1 Tax=Candidatus Tokpelaia sp. TaxID=2233777 RepID=UPI0012396E44|nr:pseudouridine synthase [Candidatus Tokpelaia sp.]KAA6405234.1 pseudouridylate synthase [Candidatus Tokpelaia sp.]
MEKKYAPRPTGKKFSDKAALPAKNRQEEKVFQPRYIDNEEEKGERIAKRLARVGLASRREAEMMIAAGRVAVNGRVLASPAVNIKRGDNITVDGQALPVKERTRLWLYHKPAGLITTSRDPAGRATVFDRLPAALPRVLAVGRLDINTEGLLLLTNDGGLARVLELPSTGWVRRYRVRVHGKTSRQQLDRLKDGIVVDGIFYGAAEAVLEREQGSNSWLSIAVKEGKNHEIKNILGALGLTVARLIRISFGPFQLADLEPGMVLEVRGRILRDQLGAKLVQEANLDFSAPVAAVFPNGPVAARSDRSLPETAPDFADKAGRRGDKAYPRKAGGLADKDMHNKTGRRYKERDEEGWVSSGSRRFATAAGPREKLQERPSRKANIWHGPGSRARAAAPVEAAESERRPRRGDWHRKAAYSAADRVAGGLSTGRADRQNNEWGEDRQHFDRRRNRPGQVKTGAGEYGEKAFGKKRAFAGGKPFGDKKIGARPFGNKTKYLPEDTGNVESKERSFSGGSASLAGTDKTGRPFRRGSSSEGKSGAKAWPRKAGGLADKAMRGDKPSGRGSHSLKRGRHADNRR